YASAGTVFTAAGHGLSENSIVYFSWTSTPTGAGTGPYYVIGTPVGNDFQVSATKGGSTVTFSTDGTGTIVTEDVSGYVTFKGKAYDDQRIQRITATITGFDPDGSGGASVGSEFDIWTFAGGPLIDSDATNDLWKMELEGSNYLTTDYGQVFNWKFSMNANFIASGAASNVPVAFKIYDYRATPNTDTTGMNVDIVPYISSLELLGTYTRDGSNRYPYFQGDAAITLKGYNLVSSTTQDGNNRVEVVGAYTMAMDLTTMTAARTEMELTVPTNTLSGNFNVVVNGISSINNTNSNAPAYNTELPGDVGFSDNRYVYIDDTAAQIHWARFGYMYNVDAVYASRIEDNVDDYDYNVITADGTLTGIREGHVEYAASSTFDGTDADVSGEIIFRGKAYDNRRISKITVAIAGFDPDGAGTAYAAGDEFDVATWNGSSLVGVGTTYYATNGYAFAIDAASETISQTNGHAVNWAFTWNSRYVTNVAALNAAVSFKAYDTTVFTGTGTRAISTTLDGSTFLDGKNATVLRGQSAVIGSKNVTITDYVDATGIITFNPAETALSTGYTIYLNGVSSIADATGTNVTRPSTTSLTDTDLVGSTGVALGQPITVAAGGGVVTGFDAVTGTITFSVADATSAVAYSIASLSSSSSIVVDVVPYISSITTKINSLLGKNYNRSARGEYTVWTNTTSATNTFETVTVAGFNLNPSSVAGGAASDIRLSHDTDGLASGARQGAGLMGSAPASPYKSMTVQMGTAANTAVTVSGYLNILVNGIPTINNVNDNNFTDANEETTPIHTAVYDDRYLQVWNLNTLRTNATYTTMANATYPSMAINVDTPQFA
ncbi:MAG: hypothetical protein Q8M65_10180, partial [Rhodoglobus sp.]|nr:hypothetical protein [Rhodoglobus sp.]